METLIVALGPPSNSRGIEHPSHTAISDTAEISGHRRPIVSSRSHLFILMRVEPVLIFLLLFTDILTS